MKKNNSLKFVAVNLLLVGLVYGVLTQAGFFDKKKVEAKDAVMATVAQAKAAGNLTKEQEQLLALQLAISDYMVSYLRPPDKLSALVPAYFESVPVNPLTNKEYDYEVVDGRPLLGGQIKEAKDLKENPQGKVEDQRIEIEEIDAIFSEQYVYNPEGKRDPFFPIGFVATEEIDEDKPPLERVSLGQLKVTAVIEDSKGQPVALVEDGSGTGYTIKVGTRVGNRDGVVAVIEPDVVKIVETYSDFTGKSRQRVVELELVGRDKTSKMIKKGKRKGVFTNYSN